MTNIKQRVFFSFRKKTGITCAFLCYFVAVICFFTFQIFSHSETIYDTFKLGNMSKETLEIRDGVTVDFTFRVMQSGLKGITIDDYFDSSYVFSDEQLIATVYDATTDELMETLRIRLRDQYSESLYHSNVYFPFEKQYPVGTKLRVVLVSKGLTNKSIAVGVSETYESSTVTRINGWYNSNKSICATLYYEKPTGHKNVLENILMMIACIGIGMLLLFFSTIGKMPILHAEHSVQKTGDVNRKPRNILLNIGIIFIVLFCFAGFYDYVNTFSIERFSKKQKGIFDYTGDTITFKIHIDNGQKVSQLFLAEENDLSGIGISVNYVKDDEGKEDTETNKNTRKGKMRCEVYDLATEQLVFDKTYALSKLTKFGDNIPLGITSDQLERLDKYRYLDFNTIIHNSKDRLYKIVLSVEGTTSGLNLRSYAGGNYACTIDDECVPGSIWHLSLYSEKGFLRKIYQSLCCFVIVLLLLLLIWYFFIKRGRDAAFFLTFIAFSFIFSLLVPPYCVPDERSHIDSGYIVSNQLLGIDDNQAGPSRIYMRECDIDSTKDNTMNITEERYRELFGGLFKKTSETNLRSVKVRSAVSNVTILHYIPIAIGFSIARMLGFNQITMIMFGRWCNILFLSFLFFAGVRIIPFGKTAFMTLCFFPTVLQQCSSCSYDGIIIGSICIFVSVCLHVAVNESSTVLEWALILMSGSMISLSKGGVYIPVLGILLMIPLLKVSNNRKERWVGTISGTLIFMAVFVSRFAMRIMTILFRKQGNANRLTSSGTSQSLYTMGYFVKNPKLLIRLFQNTIYVKGDNLLSEMIGSRLGKLNVYIPWFVLCGFFLLFFISAQKRSNEQLVFKKTIIFYLGFLALSSAALITLSMLFAWTIEGTEYIDGIQGRYYLPLLCLAAMCLRGKGVVREKMSDERMLICNAGLVCIAIGNIVLAVFKC